MRSHSVQPKLDPGTVSYPFQLTARKPQGKFPPMLRIDCLLKLLVGVGILAGPATAREDVSFNRDVRPILSTHCFQCHGPDEETRQGGLRLDQSPGISDVFGTTSLEDNEGWIRLNSDDVDEQMPPPSVHGGITTDEKQILKRWILAGAADEIHWSLAAPQSHATPPVKDQAWVRNPIDAHVLATMESRGLRPKPVASRYQLIRRLSLDLTGLPPTLDEVDAFVSDQTASAYENAVDRLLASPHFGERMAVPWLDAARYADTNGFSIDDHRDMWLWREWVIDAYNRNLPYDQFIIQQLAGDLLSNATPQNQLATGFLRNSMNTHEGGTLPEEYRVIYIADKVDTVATVFMGMTMRCAQCHDHKYDPVSQKEYYQFYAFFDTAYEPGNGANNGNTDPIIRMDGPLTERATFQTDLAERIATLRRYQIHPPELIQARLEWEQTVSAEDALAETIQVPAGQRTDSQWKIINEAFAKTTPLWDRHVTTIDREIAVLERDQKAGQASVMVMKEQGPRQTFVLNRGQYDQPDQNQPVAPTVPAVLPPLTIKRPPSPPTQPATASAWQSAQWVWDELQAATTPQGNSPRFFRYEFELDQIPQQATLKFTADNRSVAFMNGHKLGDLNDWSQPASLDVVAHLCQGKNSIAIEAINEGGPAGLLVSLVIDGEVRLTTDAQWKVTDQLEPDWASKSHATTHWPYVKVLGPSSMSPWLINRPTAVRDPNLPTRLDLAHWLVDEQNPLTARVAVNRYWQTLFGRGLVSTPNDFGSQGSYPTHPELLDWLALYYREINWDTKQLIKTMVMSSTYRQSSAAPRDEIQNDPLNLWLSRAARYRLPAEFIRDGALAIAGPLNSRIGGPSVYPSQPHGLWREISHFGYGKAFSAQAFYPSDTQGLYRRSMYTFWKRTSPPPSLIAFDAPTREVCSVQRSRTNTPLQALVLLNDPEFVAAARMLAKRAMLEGGQSVEDRLQFMFRLATARLPDSAEQSLLINRYHSSLATYRKAPKSSAEDLDTHPELDAWSVVAAIVLNLDEVITRE